MKTIKEQIQALLDSPVTGYQISKATGINQGNISKLRSGERLIDDLTVATADKILKFISERGINVIKYDLVKNTLEIEKKEDYHKGITFEYDGDQDPEILFSFDTEKEALEELKKYKSDIRRGSNVYVVTEFYVEENIYTEDGEFVGGTNVVEISDLED